MLQDSRFEAIWQTIKTWDIHVPNAYAGYEGATGNHVRAILDALIATAPGMTDLMVAPESLDAYMEENPLPVVEH
jgi:hypothetical protein